MGAGDRPGTSGAFSSSVSGTSTRSTSSNVAPRSSTTPSSSSTSSGTYPRKSLRQRTSTTLSNSLASGATVAEPTLNSELFQRNIAVSTNTLEVEPPAEGRRQLRKRTRNDSEDDEEAKCSAPKRFKSDF